MNCNSNVLEPGDKVLIQIRILLNITPGVHLVIAGNNISHLKRPGLIGSDGPAEDLLEIVMRRYERASTLLTSNRPVEDWGKLLGDTAAVTAMLDRILHHGHVLKCGPRSWRTKTQVADNGDHKEGSIS